MVVESWRCRHRRLPRGRWRTPSHAWFMILLLVVSTLNQWSTLDTHMWFFCVRMVLTHIFVFSIVFWLSNYAVLVDDSPIYWIHMYGMLACSRYSLYYHDYEVFYLYSLVCLLQGCIYVFIYYYYTYYVIKIGACQTVSDTASWCLQNCVWYCILVLAGSRYPFR